MDELRKKKVVFINHLDIHKCPHVIMVPEHYNNDGSCRCNDEDHQDMKEWGYEWDGESWIAPEEEEEEESCDSGEDPPSIVMDNILGLAGQCLIDDEDA